VTVLDSRGAPVPLGPELGRGGEGSVFGVANRPLLVAKLYHRPVDAEHAAKIAAMAALQTDRLLRLAAWPVETLFERPGGPVVGLLMPRVTGFKPIHNLYSPKARRAEFSTAGWPFLIHAATNVARAFAVVHEHGHVVGDVNHGNIVVSGQATVRLIDCDSFQVTAAGRTYLCNVGVSTHQPPEMQARSSYRGVTRTSNHDNFGLAVLIFQTLLMGRHPFAGAYQGAGDMPIERAIQENRFAYGSAAGARQMQPPPGSPPLDVVSQPVVSLFERAFSPAGWRDGGRPGAREWLVGLEHLAEQLKRCSRSPGHSYLESLPACPWCEIEGRTGILLFAASAADPPIRPRGIDITAIWAEIDAVASSGAAPRLPSLQTLRIRPSPRATRQGRVRRVRQGLAAAVTVLGGLGWSLGSPVGGAPAFLDFVAPAATAWAVLYRGSEAARSAGQQRRDLVGKRWRTLAACWKSEAGDQAFRAKRRDLERARDEYLALPTRRQQSLQQIQTDPRYRQLQRFLDRYPVSAARIAGVGPGREATLRSYGIETAADVTPEALAAVPGFGPALTSQLIAWHQQLSRSFVYDPTRGVDPRDVADLENDLRARKHRLEQSLQNGAAELRQLAQEALTRRQSLRTEIERALTEVVRAEADLAVL
jgi:DNA-binding helix-hairpin-helix protein with protein kinase domain